MTGTDLALRHDLTLQEKIEYAEKLAAAGLLPEVYRRQPANVLYAIEYGEMLNLPALAAINGIHVIKGKPTASAALIASLVRRAGHRLRQGYDAERRVGWAEIVRHDDPEFVFRSEWTVARAVDAGLCEIKDGKPWARDEKGRATSWERYTQAMLKHRALTECARDACEEALNGVHYTPEELGADVDESGELLKAEAVRDDRPATAAPGVDWDAELAAAGTDLDALRGMWRRARAAEPANTALTARIEAAVAAVKAAAGSAAAAAEPAARPVDTEVIDAEVVEQPSSPAAPATAEQLTRIHIAFGRCGVTDPVDKRVSLGQMVGRNLASSKELTRTEADRLIGVLRRIAEGDSDPAAALADYLTALTDTEVQQ